MEDFYFGSSSERRRLSAEGKLTKLYAGLYTSIKDPKVLHSKVKSQWPHIVSKIFPTTVINYRTALEFKPSPEGFIFLSSRQNKTVKIGGLRFKQIKESTVESKTDRAFLMGATTASKERAILQMLKSPRRKPQDDRYLEQERIEEYLEDIMKANGEKDLNNFRDSAREVSRELSLKNPFKKLEVIIGALLGSRKVSSLKGDSVKKRAKGKAYDRKRVDLFRELALALAGQVLPKRKDLLLGDHLHVQNKAFFESYFSNYIEGTEFLIEEAESIIFDKEKPAERPDDSHDIFGTFSICSDLAFLTKPYKNPHDFLDDLKHINKSIIPTRIEKSPGEFKTKQNQAGNTLFVHPAEVEGTLDEGFKIFQDLDHPFAKAIFLSFVVSEVHPFADGNGRTSRIILNRELLKENFPTIIIPTVFREDYLGALRNATKRQRFEPLFKMFSKALSFSNLDFSKYQSVKKTLISRNWFQEPNEAKILT